MEETIKNLEYLWKYVKETVTLDKLNTKSAKLGFRDQIIQRLSQKVFQHDNKQTAPLVELGTELPEDRCGVESMEIGGGLVLDPFCH
jgi:hypothetical protein